MSSKGSLKRGCKCDAAIVRVITGVGGVSGSCCASMPAAEPSELEVVNVADEDIEGLLGTFRTVGGFLYTRRRLDQSNQEETSRTLLTTRNGKCKAIKIDTNTILAFFPFLSMSIRVESTRKICIFCFG